MVLVATKRLPEITTERLASRGKMADEQPANNKGEGLIWRWIEIRVMFNK